MKSDEKNIWNNLLEKTFKLDSFRNLPDSEKITLKKCITLYENDEDIECFRIVDTLTDEAQFIFRTLRTHFRWDCMDSL